MWARFAISWSLFCFITRMQYLLPYNHLAYYVLDLSNNSIYIIYYWFIYKGFLYK